MKCPICHRARCIWVEVKDLEKAKTERLKKVMNHNHSYIEMIFRDGGSASSEERAYARLSPYQLEIERRTNE